MFKDKLKQLREEAGLSQQSLADKLFVSRSAIAKWENGNGIPSDVNLDAICKFFDVKEEWLLDRKDLKETIKTVDDIQNNMSIVFFLSISFILLICLLIGGNYWMHRIAIVFTIVYFVSKLFLYKSKISKTLCFVTFVISTILSIINWFITAIPEPTNFFRIFEIFSSINDAQIALSQLSSILNLFMITTANTIFMMLNKKDFKKIIGSVFISIWCLIDIICMVLSVFLIIMLFIPTYIVLNPYDSFAVLSTYSNILGGYTVIPVMFGVISIVLSIFDLLVNQHIVFSKNQKLIKAILITLTVAAYTSAVICYYISFFNN